MAIKKKPVTPLRLSSTPSEKNIRALIDISPSPVMVYDKNARFVEWNKACESLYGYTRKEIIGKTIYETVGSKASYERSKYVNQKIFEGEIFESVEWKDVHENGDSLDVITTNFPMFDQDGSIKYIVGICVDMTDKKKAEEALRESEENYRLIADASPFGMFRVNLAGTFVYTNKAGAGIAGYTPEELIGRNFSITVRKRRVKSALNILKDLFKGEYARGEFSVKHKDGYDVPIYYSFSPIKRDGKIIGVTGVTRDLTEQKAAEKQLRMLSDSVEGAHDAIFITDLGGQITYVNQSAVKLFGYSRNELIDSTLEKLNTDLKVFAEIERSTADRGLWRGQPILKAKSGKLIPVSEVVTAIKGDNGESFAFMSAVRDLTDLKLAEEKYKALFKKSNDAIIIIDVITREILDVNDRASGMLGYTKKELRKMKITEVDAPGTKEIVKAADREFNLKGYSVFENKYQKSDGTIIPVEVSCSILEYGGQKVAQSIVRDISRRKKDEEQIRLLSDAVKNSIDGVTITDLSGKIIYANEAQHAMYGYDLDELISKTIWILNAGSDPKKISDSHIKIVKREGHSQKSELQVKRKDGSRFLVQVDSALIHNAEQQPFAIVNITRDVTEERHAQEELASLQAFSENIIESLVASLCVVDTHGRITRMNAAGYKIHGVSKSVIGKYFFKEFSQLRSSLEAPLHSILQGGEPYTVYGVSYHPPGLPATGFYDQRIYPLREGDKITGAIIAMRDVTEFEKVRLKANELAHLNDNIIQSMSDGLIAVDLNFNIVTFNEAAEHVFNFPRDRALGGSIDHLFTRDNSKTFRKLLKKTLKENKVKEAEFEFKTFQGSRKTILLKMSVLKDASDRITGIFILGK